MLDNALEKTLIHDLKSPLSGITGTIDLFLDGILGELQPEQKEYLENIKMNAGKLAGLIDSWEAVTDFECNDFRLIRSEVPVSELLAKILPQFAALTGKEGKKIEIHDGNNLCVDSDPDLLGRVLAILIQNALKQVTRNGRVILKINKIKDRINFDLIAKGALADKELLPHLFEKDFKAAHYQQRAMTAPGLSFYFCRLIIEAHGGSIGADAVPEGIRYHFTLS
jgi:K+-sensing histidine kinase KdpD